MSVALQCDITITGGSNQAVSWCVFAPMVVVAESYSRARIQTSRVTRVAHWTWVGFVFGLALLMAGLMIGPRVAPIDQRSTCIGNVDLPGPFGFGLNCDSPQFLWLAREPDGLLEQNNERQTRPGLII